MILRLVTFALLLAFACAVTTPSLARGTGSPNASQHSDRTISKTPTPAGPLPIPYPNVGKTAKQPATYLRGNNGGNRKGGRY
jgi:hypothetical protein